MRLPASALLAGALAWLAPDAAGAAPLAYDKPDHWVCHPDQPDACAFDLSATEIDPDGSTQLVPFEAPAQPKIDCFYVYPTVSHGPAANAPAMVGEDERRAARQQFARFASVCRLFAPLYRQITVTSMTAAMQGKPLPGAESAGEVAQADVDEAWRVYLTRYNQGRGVVLIGHSQGAAMLASLMQRRIDGAPEQARLISAVLAGGWVLVPKGEDVGGTFKAIPACREKRQTGCVITFGAYWRDRPVPEAQVRRFGEREPLCTNPAALGGGAGPIHPVVSTAGETIIPELSGPQAPWLAVTDISTPFITLPGRYVAGCRNDANGVWLAIARSGEPSVIAADPVGEWLVDGRADATMGLHLIDLNLVMGDLLEVVGAQAEAYLRRRR